VHQCADGGCESSARSFQESANCFSLDDFVWFLPSCSGENESKEIFLATATYAAVLVAFVSSSGSSAG
jgi:hypothetical protein